MSNRLQFKVVGEDPRQAADPLFCNFLAVSHAGTEVQLEFIFLDINQVTQHLQKAQPTGSDEPVMFEGKTVAKIVMPGWAFIQVKDHLKTVFEKIEVSGGTQETSEERSYGS